MIAINNERRCTVVVQCNDILRQGLQLIELNLTPGRKLLNIILKLIISKLLMNK